MERGPPLIYPTVGAGVELGSGVLLPACACAWMCLHKRKCVTVRGSCVAYVCSMYKRMQPVLFITHNLMCYVVILHTLFDR